ncbi:MAG: DNA-3-methyladenine glycosylase 2 family protein [Steroidobacteraceae bacterium]
MKAKLLRHFRTKDPIVAGIVSSLGQYRLKPAKDGSSFQALAESIASQQISGLVARKILERLVALHGGTFPSPVQLAASTPEQLRAVGFSFAKIAALHDLAAHCVDGRLPNDATLAAMDDEAIIERCIALRGIGRWTAQMLLMFHFGRQDVMPVDDFGVRKGFQLAYGLKGMPKPKALLVYAERWKPYRSAGAWYMWRAIELHKEDRLPKRAGRAPRIEIMVEKSKTAAKRKPAKKSAPSAGSVACRKATKSRP